MTLQFSSIKNKSFLTDGSICSDNLRFGFLDSSVDCRYSKIEFISKDNIHCPVSFLNQVHGSKIVRFSGYVEPEGLQADGWFSELESLKNCAIGIKTADCFPVILLAQKAGFVCILHCGWRSVIAQIIPEALKLFSNTSVQSSNIQAYIGPGAQSCCYEVSDELYRTFSDRNISIGMSGSCYEVLKRKDEKQFISISNFSKTN